jgi:hypothetical protein
MTIRETVYSLLSTDPVLASLTFTEVWNVEAVDNPDRHKPFLVTAWAEGRPVFGESLYRDLVVWAHDDGGDFTRIDAALERVRILLVDLVHEGGISQVSYTGSSPDLYDDGFRTITRNYGFRINGSG